LSGPRHILADEAVSLVIHELEADLTAFVDLDALGESAGFFVQSGMIQYEFEALSHWQCDSISDAIYIDLTGKTLG
jgi:hypothetical protein